MKRIALAALALLAAATLACGAPEPAPEAEPAEPAAPAQESGGGVLRVDPRMDGIGPPDARIEKLAVGFVFS
ncbi:MAG: hypothetical protein F4057_06145, partial [Acidobacteria bacterium]|nr:hypothetical protein [Acidobacteriota bacterium]